MSLLLPANVFAVLPYADSPYPTNSNTQSLLDDDDPSLASDPSLSSMLIERLFLCPQFTYFDSTASKGLSFVSNGLLSSRPSQSNSDVG
jgi:hypothetical protein